MSKTSQELAEEYFKDYDECEFAREAYLAGYKAAQDQLADTSKVINSSKTSNSWIKVSDKLPKAGDGMLQFWLPKEGLTAIVIGYQATMYESETDSTVLKHGVADIHRPNGLWDLEDFLYWMKIPSLPNDFPRETFEEYMKRSEAIK